jgi:alpha-tubulin suppressor-like RCC1 family protein
MECSCLAAAGGPRCRRRSVPAALLAAVLLVIAAAAQASASTAGGQPLGFGVNAAGDLGSTTNNGSANPNPTPTLIGLPGATGAVTQLAVGANFSLAATSTGQLYSFGVNDYGQLGSTANVETNKPNPTPALVVLPGATGPVTAIAAGANFGLAATSTGQLYGFGENGFGQLGNTTNSGIGKANPTPTLISLPGATGPVAQLAAGGDHSLVLTSTGQLYTFGYDAYGQLGYAGLENANPTPTLLGIPGATGPVTAMAAGVFHSLVLTSTGQLFSFGNNQYGQLGRPTNSGTETATPTPTQVSLPGASGPVAEKIAAGGFHSLAATPTGQLYSFGRNVVGELGSTTNNGSNSANPAPTLVGLPGATGPVTSVSAGLSHSLAATSTGQLFAFGLNTYGELGSPINSGTFAANPTPLLAGLPAGGTIVALAQGEAANHSLLLLAERTAVGPGSAPNTPPAVGVKPRPPVLSGVGMTNKRFRVAKSATAISSRKGPLGTTFRFSLSMPAKVQIVITRAAAGLRRGHLCAAPTPVLRRAHAKRCTRTLTVGVLTRLSLPAGANRIAFSGRIGHRALSPQPYKALLSASSSGGRSAPSALSFTVVR